MAHFAKLENSIVTQVIVIADKYEQTGEDFINNKLSLDGTWLQTSYNTYAGQHANGGMPLRKNFAGVGYSYDEKLDAFIPPKPFESWILDAETCVWQAPIEYPNDDENYSWNEQTQNWQLIEIEEN